MAVNKFVPPNPHFAHRVADSFNRQGFMRFINAELIKTEPGYCEIKIPYSENLTQQHGFFHAGVVTTIADNSAGYAAFSLMKDTSSVLSVEFKINFMAPAKGDCLMAKGQVVKNGKTLTICNAEVYAINNGEEKLCAMMQATLMELRGTSDQKK